MPLTRQDVLSQALAILDVHGFADLSMRRVASALGVQPGALYWHVANKQTLLTAVAELILTDVFRPTCERDWACELREWARSLRAALLRHRDGAELVAAVLSRRSPTTNPASIAEALLTRAGLDTEAAHAAALSVVHFVMGHTVDEQSYAVMRQFGVADGVDAQDAGERFDYGLELLIDGLRNRIEAVPDLSDEAQHATLPRSAPSLTQEIGVAGCSGKGFSIEET